MIIYCHAVLIALSFETSRVIIIIVYHKIREMMRLNNLSSHTPGDYEVGIWIQMQYSRILVVSHKLKRFP